ncbi:hypothetical protein M8C21_016104 [Ambrosia artemisiifolia]|uniref:Uncharacterized protein n=1 Tax=Ambrosia artemisiifolia TaxID=4212 RepID=A0AAD5C9I3_AMBAR|nr:hypothetical protein M8C21_016104 [Ambrosia artemisiifolia]
MDKPGVWLTCPMSTYLQHELSTRFTLFKSWEIPSKHDFFNQHSHSIKAIVGNGVHGADSALIESLPCLEIISSHSSGLDKIDLVKCTEKGIRVTSTPDMLTDEVADLAVLLVLATLRKICVCDRFVRNGLWKQQDFQLTTKVFIDALGPNGFIINIGRGAHINEPELVAALVEGRLGGAGLDVFEHEPDVPVQLVNLDNVVLSPHVGTCTIETRKAMADLVVANLVAHFSNEPLLTPVV